LKREASEANAHARRQHGTNGPDDVLARVDAIETEVQAIYDAGTVKQPKPVPFADALKTVLAGLHAVATPPKQ
jgi:hypothetical protein